MTHLFPSFVRSLPQVISQCRLKTSGLRTCDTKSLPNHFRNINQPVNFNISWIPSLFLKHTILWKYKLYRVQTFVIFRFVWFPRLCWEIKKTKRQRKRKKLILEYWRILKEIAGIRYLLKLVFDIYKARVWLQRSAHVSC